MVSKPVPIRIEDETLERVARIAEAMASRTAGLQVTKQSVLRLAIDHGVEALEQQMGIARKPRRKK